MKIRTVKTYHGNYELNDKVADIIGIKLGEHQYKSLTPGQRTIFTAPPEFDIRDDAIEFLVGIARNRGVELENTDSLREICEEFVAKFLVKI
jgi:hypothetical protein